MDDAGRAAGLIFGILFFIILVSLVVYCCCCRSKGGKQSYFQERIMSRRSTDRGGVVHYTATPAMPPKIDVPMAGPTANFPQSAPLYPAMPQPESDYPYSTYPPNLPNSGYQGDVSYPPQPPYPASPGYPVVQSGGYPSAGGYPPANPPYPIQPQGPGYQASPPPPYSSGM